MCMCMFAHARAAARDQRGLPYGGVGSFVVSMALGLPPCSYV